jgi:two-component sensor histidine kinase
VAAIAICSDWDESVSQFDIQTNAQPGMEIETDRAVSSALIVNELITNAAKYAYQGRSGGKIFVTVAREGDDHCSSPCATKVPACQRILIRAWQLDWECGLFTSLRSN